VPEKKRKKKARPKTQYACLDEILRRCAALADNPVTKEYFENLAASKERASGDSIRKGGK
jgi:hypothetical protein